MVWSCNFSLACSWTATTWFNGRIFIWNYWYYY